MKQDKILKQYFAENKKANPPADFNASIMDKILLAAEKKQKRQYWASIFLVGLVSVGMVTGSILLLKDYLLSLWSRLSMMFSNLDSQNETIKLYVFIASIALFLLLIDFFLARKIKKQV